MVHMLAAFAQMEADLIRERALDGLVAAPAAGPPSSPRNASPRRAPRSPAASRSRLSPVLSASRSRRSGGMHHRCAVSASVLLLPLGGSDDGQHRRPPMEPDKARHPMPPEGPIATDDRILAAWTRWGANSRLGSATDRPNPPKFGAVSQQLSQQGRSRPSEISERPSEPSVSAGQRTFRLAGVTGFEPVTSSSRRAMRGSAPAAFCGISRQVVATRRCLWRRPGTP
jgi:hypothetical protein